MAPLPSESGVYRALVRAGLIEAGGRRRRAASDHAVLAAAGHLTSS
ncbi:MAG: hypothetical protein ACRDOK_26235 [Streptosporangiaceae bacterium]